MRGKRCRARYRIPAGAGWIAREVLQGPGPLSGALRVVAELKGKGLIKDFAIGGGMGAMCYTEPFATLDLDVFFIPAVEGLTAGIPEMFAELRRQGYRTQHEHMVIEGIPVQLLAVDALTHEGVEHARTTDYEGIEMRILSPEHLLAVAVRTGRAKDRARVELLLEQGKINRRELNEILKRHGLTRAFGKIAGDSA